MLLKHLCHFTRKGAQDVRRSRRRHGCRPARTQRQRKKRCFLVTSLHQQRSYPLVRAEALSLKTKEKALDSRLRGNDEQRESAKEKALDSGLPSSAVVNRFAGMTSGCEEPRAGAGSQTSPAQRAN